MTRSWIEVSRSAIAANFDAVKALVGPEVEVAPVVKADAYRHGAVEVARTVVSRGAGWLCVSNTDEGIALRNAGIGARILVMADSLAANLPRALDRGLTPVLHDLGDLAALESLERPAVFHLKIDTGMGRLGVVAPPGEVARAVAACRHARLEGLMTHFASANDYVGRQTDDQLAAFEPYVDALRPPIVHAASTIPVAYGRRSAWRQLVRPGHAIYGYVSPVRSREAPPASGLDVRPAMAWKARLLAVKEVAAGSRIGYGGQFTAPGPLRIGVVAAGYADGVPHRLSRGGRVIAGGQFAPILGAVSMDVTTIDLSMAPELRPGDVVTLMGREGGASQDAQQLARVAGTISYAVLCGISARVERVYVD
jgi:alanine racemase